LETLVVDAFPHERHFLQGGRVVLRNQLWCVSESPVQEHVLISRHPGKRHRRRHRTIGFLAFRWRSPLSFEIVLQRNIVAFFYLIDRARLDLSTRL
jgi:hypothetical protein